jgi:threonine synthase
MRYRSIASRDTASFREAVLQGVAPNRGLYVPCELPRFPASWFEALSSIDRCEIAFEAAWPFVDGELTREDLRSIIETSMTFEAPVVPFNEKIAALELFHGPTFAFKDFGARFMAAVIEHFQRSQNDPLTVLVATSGDTGGAVGSGFAGREGVRVVILYPRGRVSPLQEKQLTTIGRNVTAVRVNGTFDDCQTLVKSAFEDAEIRRAVPLTSANSINIARLVPQMFYYFWAVASHWTRAPIVVSVPSGNFGNLTAGLYARSMGLPIERFIAATNVNDIVPKYLQTGVLASAPSITTIANAMDVGNPSNIARIIDLFDGDVDSTRAAIAYASYSDDQIRAGIAQTSAEFGYVVDPHGAVGYLALRDYLDRHPDHGGIFLHTAHPGKFADVVSPIVNDRLQIPVALRMLVEQPGRWIDMENSLDQLRSLLLR